MRALIFAVLLAFASAARLWTCGSGGAGTLERELATDPASPFRWCELGETLAARRAEKQAAYCFRRAAELGPNIAAVRLRAGNYYFAVGDAGQALAEMRKVRALTHHYDAFIASTCRRMGVPQLN
jgi:predicted Zn-dependent protease